LILLPAIDIRGGRTVRLIQGDYTRETVFDAHPLDAARRWVEQGARALHVVDLDGAREGRPVNLDHVREIAAQSSVPVQLGGGLRSAEAVDEALAAGVERVVIGTAALEDPALIEALVAEHGEHIVVSADAKDGKVAVEGWERGSSISAAELVGDLIARGVRRFVHTPVEVDGTLEGPLLEGLRPLAEAAQAGGGEWIYSGGVGTVDHLRALSAAELPALAGVVVGRALYEGRFTVAEGQTALDESA
jgi:phosphoribosylformimino-5-aminoimidazole carboxamide ribotide isomerase